VERACRQVRGDLQKEPMMAETVADFFLIERLMERSWPGKRMNVKS
jgi:hypothetical protein